MRGHRVLLYAVFFATTAFGAFAQSNDIARSGPGRTPINGGEWLPLTIEALGNSSLQTIREVSGDWVNYYVAPFLLYDIEQFRASVEAACQTKTATDEVTAPLSVEIASNLVNEEISRKLAVPQAANMTNVLRPYPYGLLLLYSGYFSDTDQLQGKVRWSSPPNAGEQIANGYLAVSNAFDFLQHSIDITDTCEHLRGISEGNGDFQAAIFSSMPDTKRNYFSVSYALFADSEAVENITKDESAKGMIEVTSRGGSRGIGLNLGFLTGGETSSRQTSGTSDTRQRAVTANIVENVVEEVGGTIIARRLREYNLEDKDLNQVEARLLDVLLGNVQAVVASFEEVKGQGYKLRADMIEELVLSKENVELLLKTSDKPELSGSKDATVKAAGAEASTKSTTTVKDDRGIEWQKKGDEWVPTTVKLYVLGTSSLRNSLVTAFEDIAVFETETMQKTNLTNVPKSLITEWNGPKKIVTPIQGGLYKTISYWGNHGDRHRVFECLATPVVEGATRFGGQDTRKLDGRGILAISGSGGCRGDGHCDSAGEWCVSYVRAPGCLINNVWLQWYQRRQSAAGFAISEAEICKLP